MRNLRVLHVISSVDPAGGGPIEGLRQLSSIYRSKNVDAQVACLDLPDSKFIKDFPLPVHPLGPTGWGGYRYSSRLPGWLRANRHNYDVVVVNGLWQYHGFATWLALHHTSTPYLVFPHGMLDPWFKRQYPLKHLKKWLYWPWGEYRVLRDAYAVCFTSEEEMRLAAESFALYRVNPVVIGYGTHPVRFDVQRKKEEFLEEHPALRGKRLATFVGRIHPKKGCDLLIKAFASTLARELDWQLVMMGPDQVGWQSKLEQLSAQLGIADRITWTGMLQGDRKWAAFSAMEVFVLPSHQENFGIVVAEALACRKPVLISNKINIWREVQAAEAGIVAEDTLEGTIDLLRTWGGMTDAERAVMADRALACFRDHFDLEKGAEILLGIFDQVVGDKAGPIQNHL